jgi:hypothetical protein
MARTRKAPERIEKRPTATRKPNATKKRSARTTSLNATKHSIRRILAERKVSSKGKATEDEYLIDWLPSWERKSILPNKAQEVEDWETNKKEGHTFQFNGDEVYRCLNPTEDNHEVALRTMADNVLTQFRRWMTRNPDTVAKELFDDRDWAFGSRVDAVTAAELAEFRDEAVPTTAGEVMRRTYVQMREMSQASFEPVYGRIKVKYLGQVDEDMKRAEPRMRKHAVSPTAFLDPLFLIDFRSIKPDEWETVEQLHNNMAPLKSMARRFAYTSSFMLNHPWPMMFTRLFRTSDQIVFLLEAGHGIGVNDDWQHRTRDFFLYTYMREIDDQRSIDCIERTYLGCRDRCQWHAKFRSCADDISEAVVTDGGISDME